MRRTRLVDPVNRALAALSRIEAASARLPRPRGVTPYQAHGRRVLRVGEGGVVDASPAPTEPVGEQLVPPGCSPAVDLELPLAASEVRLAKLTEALPRFRAFYPEGLTVVGHCRGPFRRTRLRESTAVSRAFHRQGFVAVPEIFEQGSARGVDWVVEELLQGEHPAGAARAHAATVLLPTLLRAGHDLGWTAEPVDTRQRRPYVDELAGLIDLRGAEEPRGAALVDGVRALYAGGGSVLVGPSHGDPVFSNVLRLGDGRWALLDWELAGRRPVGHDAVKLMTGLTDPRALLLVGEQEFEKVAPPGALAWSGQLAVASLGMLAGWRAQHDVARASGRLASFESRVRRRLDLLALLLGLPLLRSSGR